MAGIAESIEKIDTDLFLFLNQKYSEVFDPVMVFASHRGSWIPFYAFLLYLLYRVYRKRTWVFFISVSIAIFLSDKISVYIKNAVQRYRPCHNLELKEFTRVVKHCGGEFGFVSSHAANTFALALFITYFLRKDHKWIAPVMFAWATFVSYSRIYLGVHYPLDIVGGAIVGLLAAVIAIILHHRLDDRLTTKKPSVT